MMVMGLSNEALAFVIFSALSSFAPTIKWVSLGNKPMNQVVNVTDIETVFQKPRDAKMIVPIPSSCAPNIVLTSLSTCSGG